MMEAGQTELLLVSDSDMGNLRVLLERQVPSPSLKVQVSPFGDVAGALAGADMGDHRPGRGSFVWCRPESLLPSFSELVEGVRSEVDPDALRSEVSRFARLLESASHRFAFVLVATWTLPPGDRGLGMLDMVPGRGRAAVLAAANLQLAEEVARMSGVYLLDASRWGVDHDAETTSRLWYLAKMRYPRPTLERAAREVQGAVVGISGRAKKLVVVDLDDTLWGGILGDAGWEGLRLGGHDPIGEAHADFQRALKALLGRGVILGIVSKNDEGRAMDAIRSHPEMVLREADFAGWRINWEDKARNVAELARELNLGLEAVVFLDDNPSERGRVREALPQVLVPEWPDDPLRYAARLRAMTCFDQPSLSEEDLARARMYAAERARKEAREDVGSMEDWLRTLEVQVTVEAVSASSLPRTTQLLNKTNQMNLRTRRMSEGEFAGWAADPDHRSWVVRVSDRFGDYGLTGIVSLRFAPGAEGGEVAVFEDFVLSCRVFGRKVEQAMVHLAARAARARGADSLQAELLATEKNAPCRKFWAEDSGFELEDGVYVRSLEEAYPAPEWLRLVGEVEGELL